MIDISSYNINISRIDMIQRFGYRCNTKPLIAWLDFFITWSEDVNFS